MVEVGTNVIDGFTSSSLSSTVMGFIVRLLQLDHRCITTVKS